MSRLEKNKVHNMDWVEGAYLLPAKSVNLIIADPPYFEVKGAFDFIWDSFEDYLKDVEKWAKACKHLLADNGTLFVYGHAKKIAYVQVIFDRLFNLQNSLVWEKKECQTKRQDFDKARSFAPITERILFYVNDYDVNSLDEIMFNTQHFKSIKEYLKGEKVKVMDRFCFSAKQFNDYTLKLGCSTTPYKNWFCKTGFWEMATEGMYVKLQASGFFLKPYEELRQEYEELRRTFDNPNRLTDVMKFSQEGHKTGQYDHDTVKPEMLSRALILTCKATTRCGSVCLPFSTTLAQR
jgi:site-specific DNA-methyltransferase (adenine-specific)